MYHVLSEACYKGTILQKNYRKMTIPWSFSYNPFVKFHGKINGSHNMTVLYPNLCYKKVFYKRTVALKLITPNEISGVVTYRYSLVD